MRTIHCPKDIGLNNTFEGRDCECEQYYNNCYHCWASAIAENNQRYCERKLAEQEPILNEITAEIEQTADEEQKHDKKWAKGLRYAVKIINEYRKEG